MKLRTAKCPAGPENECIVRSARLAGTLLFGFVLIAASMSPVLGAVGDDDDWIEQFGITWTFDKNLSADGAGDTYQYGTFANGDYWVKGPVNIVAINPPCSVVNSPRQGGGTFTGRVVNGTVINPIPSNLQGYDSAASGWVEAFCVNAGVSAQTPLEIDVSAVPIQSLVSTISKNEVSTAQTTRLDGASILTIVDQAPSPDAFRPPYAGSTKPAEIRKSDIRWDTLASLTPVAGVLALAPIEREFERPWLVHKGRYPESVICPTNNMPSRGSTVGYGRELARYCGLAALLLNLDYTQAQKETLLLRFLQYGIDVYGIAACQESHAGAPYYSTAPNRIWYGAGTIGVGKKPAAVFAAKVLNHTGMIEMLSRTGDYLWQYANTNGYPDPYGPRNLPPDYIQFGEEQFYYVRQIHVDLTNNQAPPGWQAWDPDDRYPVLPYHDTDIGLPEWADQPAIRPHTVNKAWNGGYRQMSGDTAIGSALSFLIMDAKTIFNQDAYFDYADRHMTIISTYPIDSGWRVGTNGVDMSTTERFVWNMWETYRDDYGPVWPDSDDVAPLAPINLLSNATTESSIQLSWTAPGAASDGDLASSYRIFRTGTQVGTATQSSFQDTGLYASTSYNYHIYSVDEAGNQSISAATGIFSTSADSTPPSVVSVNASETSVTIFFSESIVLASAEDTNNYSINNGISIIAAPISVYPNIVTLTTSAHTENLVYTLSVRNIKDLNGNIMPDTTIDYQYNDGLVGYWEFNDGSGTTVEDSSGNNNDGTLVNGVEWTTGRTNGGVRLSGSTEAVEIPTGNFNAGSGTITLWAYAENFSNAKHFLFGHATQPWSNRIQLYCDASGNLTLGLGNNYSLRTNIQTLNTGEWYHIAMTWDGSNYTVFVNGAPIVWGGYASLNSLETYADIGNSGIRPGRSEAFNGTIDDVRVYNRALSADEILELYNEEASTPANNPPTAGNDSATVNEDSADNPIDVLDNDSDDDGDSINIIPPDPQATHGSVAITGGGTGLTYTPTPDYNGPDSFTYTISDGQGGIDTATVSVTVTNVPDDPEAEDDSAVTYEDTDVTTGNVLTNDTDADGDTLTIDSFTQVIHGTVAYNNDGTFTYTPAANYNGNDSFSYTVTDGNGGIDTAMVSITVISVPPTVVSATATKYAVEILFSEDLERSSAENAGNYSLSNGIMINTPALNAEPDKVTLYTTAHAEDTIYTLTITGIEDLAGNSISEIPIDYTYDSGLIGLWNFNTDGGNTALDASGYDNTATLVNGPVWTEQGDLNFDGIDDAVEIPTNYWNINSGTVALWTYAEDLAGTHYLFGHTTGSGSDRIQLYTLDQNLNLGLGNSDELNIANLDSQAWHHFALTWDGTNYVVYVDGIEIEEASGSYTGLNNLSEFADIGNSGDVSFDNAFAGYVDDARVYDRPLTPDEVVNVYLMSDESIRESKALAFEVSATYPDDTPLIYSINQLPDGATFEDDTFTWNPWYDQAGTYDITFLPADQEQPQYSQTVTVAVEDVQLSDWYQTWLEHLGLL